MKNRSILLLCIFLFLCSGCTGKMVSLEASDMVSITYYANIEDEAGSDIRIAGEAELKKMVELFSDMEYYARSEPMSFPRFRVIFYKDGEKIEEFYLDNNLLISGDSLGNGNQRIVGEPVYPRLEEIYCAYEKQ